MYSATLAGAASANRNPKRETHVERASSRIDKVYDASYFASEPQLYLSIKKRDVLDGEAGYLNYQLEHSPTNSMVLRIANTKFSS